MADNAETNPPAAAADEAPPAEQAQTEGGDAPQHEVVGSAAMRPVFLGNLRTNFSTDRIRDLFELPLQPPGAEEQPYKSIPVDRVDIKRGYCFVFLKDASSQEEKEQVEKFVSAINGMEVDRVSVALRAEFARGDGRVKRKEDDRRRHIQPSETLFVVNFHEETTKREDLQMLFEPYGELVRIDMKRNYAFVQFRTIEEAIRAKENTDNGHLDQSILTVEFVARQRGDQDRRRRRDDTRGGGGGGNRRFGGGSGYDRPRGGGGGYDRPRGGPPPERFGRGGGGGGDRYDSSGRDDVRSRGRERSPGGYRGTSPSGYRGGGRDNGYGGRDNGGGGYGRGPSPVAYRGGRDSGAGNGGGGGGYPRGNSPGGDYGGRRSRSRSRSPRGYRSRSPPRRYDDRRYDDMRGGGGGAMPSAGGGGGGGGYEDRRYDDRGRSPDIHRGYR